MADILESAEIHALFPTPVCVFKYKKDEKLENFLRNQPVRDLDLVDDIRMLPNRVNYGVCSKNIMILKTDECKELRNFILTAATSMARNVLELDVEMMEDTISWVSTKRKGEHHITHTHPNSIISGVFYFDSNVGETPLTFTKDRGATNAFEMRPKKIIRQTNFYSTFCDTDVAMHIEHREIVLFPSYLRHSVNTNTSERNRYSLAFNLVPKGHVGAEEDLTYFQYGEI